jgi:hypothetical protein
MKQTGQLNISDLDITMNAVCLPIESEEEGHAIFQDRFQMWREITEFSVKISGSTADNR